MIILNLDILKNCSKVASYKIEPCRELNRLINELTHVKEKYLPLTEHGFPVKQVFDQSCQSILQLQESFKMFTQHQLSLTQTILNKKVLAEREKVATTIVSLCKEVANLKNELIKNNKQIALLTERNKKLLNTHAILKKNHPGQPSQSASDIESISATYWFSSGCIL
ncbi:43605_t:CDS:2 [Gigaspora margarita]|uniref:43605_t:CDS:1 n=1 Tax=Gigaspora margarita TaxID=4874 RepID=A0ABN7WGR3_GIGMA|nr:43605_t:CDS:2 [Gigaspora margarita]